MLKIPTGIKATSFTAETYRAQVDALFAEAGKELANRPMLKFYLELWHGYALKYPKQVLAKLPKTGVIDWRILVQTILSVLSLIPGIAPFVALFQMIFDLLFPA